MRDLDDFAALEEYKLEEGVEMPDGKIIESTGELSNEVSELFKYNCPQCRESDAERFNEIIDSVEDKTGGGNQRYTNFLNVSKALIPHITEEDVRIENARKFEEIDANHGDLALYDSLFSFDYARISSEESKDLTCAENAYGIIMPEETVADPDDARRDVSFAKKYSGHDSFVNLGIFCVLDKDWHTLGERNAPGEAYEGAKNVLERLGYDADSLFSGLEEIGKEYSLSKVDGYEL